MTIRTTIALPHPRIIPAHARNGAESVKMAVISCEANQPSNRCPVTAAIFCQEIRPMTPTNKYRKGRFQVGPSFTTAGGAGCAPASSFLRTPLSPCTAFDLAGNAVFLGAAVCLFFACPVIFRSGATACISSDVGTFSCVYGRLTIPDAFARFHAWRTVSTAVPLSAHICAIVRADVSGPVLYVSDVACTPCICIVRRFCPPIVRQMYGRTF